VLGERRGNGASRCSVMLEDSPELGAAAPGGRCAMPSRCKWSSAQQLYRLCSTTCGSCGIQHGVPFAELPLSTWPRKVSPVEGWPRVPECRSHISITRLRAQPSPGISRCCAKPWHVVTRTRRRPSRSWREAHGSWNGVRRVLHSLQHPSATACSGPSSPARFPFTTRQVSFRRWSNERWPMTWALHDEHLPCQLSWYCLSLCASRRL
jgi:hypothetical protein